MNTPLQVSRLVIEGLAVRCFDAKHLEVQIFPNGEVGASGRRIAAQFMLQQGKGECRSGCSPANKQGGTRASRL